MDGITRAKPEDASGPCPCCGHVNEDRSDFTCDCCYWERSYYEEANPSQIGPVNRLSLNAARELFEQRGGAACRLAQSCAGPTVEQVKAMSDAAVRERAPQGVEVQTSDYNRDDVSPTGMHPVQLGRDLASRKHQPDPEDPSKRRYECLCCGAFSLSSVDNCETCRRCGWEDWYECHDRPNDPIRPNYISLTDARSIVAKYGPGAAFQVNRARGLARSELEAMTPSQIANLKGMNG